jgi:hypothetical protein
MEQISDPGLKKIRTATLLQTELRIGIILVPRYPDPHLTFHFDADPDLDPNPTLSSYLLDNLNFFLTFNHNSVGLHCFIQIVIVILISDITFNNLNCNLKKVPV